MQLRDLGAPEGLQMPFLPEQTRPPGGKAAEKYSLKGADPLSAPS